MRFLLVSVAGCPRSPSDFIPDNGLALLAAILRENGHFSKILDYNTPSTLRRCFPPHISRKLQGIAEKIFKGEKPGFREIISLSLMEKSLAAHHRRVFYEIGAEIADIVARERFDAVGLKLWNGDGITASFAVAEVIKKRNPRTAVFGGGPHVDSFQETLLSATNRFDAFSYGEGEKTILDLCNFVQGKKNLEDIPNLIFRKGTKIVTTPQQWIDDLDRLPFGLYDPETYPGMDKNERLKYLVLDESRGCSYSCSFCPHPRKSGKPKTKSADRIVDEIEHYRKTYGVSLFRYAGSNTPSRLLNKTAEEIIRRGLTIEYTGFTDLRGNGPDFSSLKQSGCFGLFFGIESADERILTEKMNKRSSPADMEKILLAAKKAGIFCVTSLIIPSPGETEKSKQTTFEFLRRTLPDAAVVQFPGLFPGTAWAREPERFGFSVGDIERYKRRVMTYKIRLFFPPRLWDPLPYRIDGKPFRQYVGETEEFVKRIEQLGIPTSISDDWALMAKHAGCTPREFRDSNRLNFFTGNADALHETIMNINANTERLLP